MKTHLQFFSQRFKMKYIFLFLAISITNLTYSQTQLSIRVNNANDDLEEYLGTVPLGVGITLGSYDLASSDLELGQEDATINAQLVGIRFNNVTIPQGAVILSAKINFTVDATSKNSNPSNLVIQGEDADNSAAFSTAALFNLSSRPKVSDSVSMTFANTSWSTVGTTESTDDISSIIQSIVNRPGWSSGNSLSLFVKGSGVREAESYDGSAFSAPELELTYVVPTQVVFQINASNNDAEEAGANATSVSPGTIDITSTDLELVRDGNDGDQYVGMRFDNIGITNGATITSAYIQFTVDETGASTGDKYIMVEDVDNSSFFTLTPFSISSRSTTSDTVIWTNIPLWITTGVSGIDQRTPDITNLIQSTVNRAGWLSGNALNIIIHGTGRRVAESYDGSSSEAPQLVINYIPNIAPLGDFPVDSNEIWAFNDADTNLPASWSSLNYNDTSWAFGQAQLGYGESDENTVIGFGGNASNKYKTAYFRHKFEVLDSSMYDSLIIGLVRDDGAVVYLNGVEIIRSNMPTGSISYSTLASSIVGGADESKFYLYKVPNTLRNGLNSLAVEIHQSDVTSSDLSFDLFMEGTLPPAPTTNFPIDKGSSWSYLDDGSNQDSTWRFPSFNFYPWAYGDGQLGYGDADENTVISYGPNSSNKYPTSYFVKKIIVDTTGLKDSVRVGLMRDDGAVVYLNGQEIIRDNMSSGLINHTSYATATIGGSDESTYFEFIFSKNILLHGANYIAVEIHQADPTSSDLSFDLYFDEAPDPLVEASGCTQGNEHHFSCFTSISPTSQTQGLIIPETHAYQVISRQGDTYDNGGSAPGNHDFTGYVAMNGSSKQGYVNVNHENSPGGVSVMDVSYTDSIRIWNLDSLNRVDMYNNDLVTTTRNCSGGITPWGTMISSEETFNSGDANADGYQDVGWNVEVDPVTRKVKTYGTSKQEKLWALGRMSHENVVVSDDSVTVYEGEDGGTQCVYKFVANTPGDLSSGSLYVLQLPSGLSGGEPNGSTGNWIMVPNTTQSDRNNTRSLGGALGGTNFNGVEDVEIDPLTGQIYFTSKGHDRVYRFTDNGTTVSDFETYVGGQSYSFIINGNKVTEPWAGGNDNLVFDDLGNLYVLQDGSRNYIWMVRAGHSQSNPKVELFASPPSGSEPTGATFTPDNKFMFVSIQHPSGGNGSQTDASGQSYNMNVSMTVVIARKEYLGMYSPDQQSTNLQSINADSCSSVELSWTSGDGDARIVVARESSTNQVMPEDGHLYNASSIFGNGDTTGLNNFVVYDGTSNTTVVSGLDGSKSYDFDVYEYSMESNLPFYNTNNPATFNFSFNSVANPSIVGDNSSLQNELKVYSVTIAAGQTCNWTVLGGNFVSGQGSSTVTVEWTDPSQGTIEVQVESDQGCIGNKSSKNVSIGTGIDVLSDNAAIKLYPNPSSGITSINLDKAYNKVDIKFFNANGAQVNPTVENDGQVLKFNASDLKVGYYMIQLNLDGQVINRKLIVQ